MVIYAEYLFLENFITGIILLRMTAEICGLNTRAWKMVIGGILCGAFSFIIFADIGIPFSIVLKVVFAVAVNGLIQPLTVKITLVLRSAFVFFTVSFLSGGITIALLYISGIKGISANGYVYAETPTYFMTASGIFISYIFVRYILKLSKNRKIRSEYVKKIYVKAGGMTFEFTGFTDTGNGLREPFSGKPVCLMTACTAAMIFMKLTDEEVKRRKCIIPFTAAGSADGGIMNGFRADEMRIYHNTAGISYVTVKPAYFAIYEGEFEKLDDGTVYEVLLNKEIPEGGII